MSQLDFHARNGRIAIDAAARRIGDDWLVEITGGEAHLGGCALGTFDQVHRRASVSVLSAPGHREEGVVMEAARTIARATKGTVVVVAGIHYPEITPEEIAAAGRLCGELAERVAAATANIG